MDAKEVAARETTLRETAEQFREQAARDPLTRLWNRAYLAATLEQELARCRRHGRPLTLLVLDLDKFRRVNNVHGHQEGDRVLLALARAMQESTRMGDILTRYAGDEFCVLLPDTGRVEAAKGADRLRECVRAVRTRGTGGGFISTSIGGACTEEFREAPSSAELFSRADRRLQAAKAAGGDRVVLDDEATSEPRSAEGAADLGVHTRLP
jgi:diguanylate cyclase (GGDEF)-like protein